MTDICFDLCTCGSVVVSDATAVAELKADNERLLAANRDLMLHWNVLKSDYDKLRAALRDIRDMGPMTVDDQRWRIAKDALEEE